MCEWRIEEQKSEEIVLAFGFCVCRWRTGNEALGHVAYFKVVRTHTHIHLYVSAYVDVDENARKRDSENEKWVNESEVGWPASSTRLHWSNALKIEAFFFPPIQLKHLLLLIESVVKTTSFPFMSFKFPWKKKRRNKIKWNIEIMIEST